MRQSTVHDLETALHSQQQQYEAELRSSNTELGRLRRELEEVENKAGEGDRMVLQYRHTVDGLKEDLDRTQQLHKSAMEQVMLILAVHAVTLYALTYRPCSEWQR